MVDNFYFYYCVESVIIFHEVIDDLAEVADLDADILQEVDACPLSHNCDYLRVTFGHI